MPVVPTLNQDYPAWHLGREHYALWYLEILDPDLLAYLATLREHFSDILYTPNTRQFQTTAATASALILHEYSIENRSN